MPSANNLLTLTAILALATLHPTTVTANKNNVRKNRNNRRLRRGQVNHIADTKKEEGGGLEEDVTFWTNMARRTQDMSVPGPTPPAPTPTNPPVIVDPTDPPIGGGGGSVPTNPPVGGPVPTLPPIVPTPSGPPQPVAAIVCAQGELCTDLGDVCADGTTEDCCGETFDSFVCTCENGGGGLKFQCKATEACKDKVCTTDPPAPGPVETMNPTVEQAGGFVCPSASFVDCTAVDPANPINECPVVGEPCPSGNAGEFCCLDACPRRYCTAKQGVSSLQQAQVVTTKTSTTAVPFEVPIDWLEINP